MPHIICADPGHGMSNRHRLKYDTGAIGVLDGVRYEEAGIALRYVNYLREILQSSGYAVIRTRRDALDPAPVERRDDIARAYNCNVMVSIHCNSANGKARGSEVFYRGSDDRAKAEKLSAQVSNALAIPDRGAKTEKESQHKSLAVLEFDKCWLIELGFIDNPRDLAAMINPDRMAAVCRAIAAILTTP